MAKKKPTKKKPPKKKPTKTAKKKTVRRSGAKVVPSGPGQTPHGSVALAFARALTAGRYAEAHDLLTPARQGAMTEAELRETYEAMISYGGSPADLVEVMNVMEAWPAKEPGDVGWAYVAVSGDGYGEGITVVVASIDGSLRIREIEWGRP